MNAKHYKKYFLLTYTSLILVFQYSPSFAADLEEELIQTMETALASNSQDASKFNEALQKFTSEDAKLKVVKNSLELFTQKEQETIYQWVDDSPALSKDTKKQVLLYAIQNAYDFVSNTEEETTKEDGSTVVKISILEAMLKKYQPKQAELEKHATSLPDTQEALN